MTEMTNTTMPPPPILLSLQFLGKLLPTGFIPMYSPSHQLGCLNSLPLTFSHSTYQILELRGTRIAGGIYIQRCCVVYNLSSAFTEIERKTEIMSWFLYYQEV